MYMVIYVIYIASSKRCTLKICAYGSVLLLYTESYNESILNTKHWKIVCIGSLSSRLRVKCVSAIVAFMVRICSSL